MHQSNAVAVYNAICMNAPPESEMVILYQQLRGLKIVN